MAERVCVDASLTLLRVLVENRTPAAEALFSQWRSQRTRLMAPPMFNAEVTSVIRQKVFDRLMEPADGERAFAQSLRWRVAIRSPHGLQREAWACAKTINQRRAYDAQYLALASLLGCELWTGDERLYNASRQAGLSWVHWVGEVVP